MKRLKGKRTYSWVRGSRFSGKNKAQRAGKFLWEDLYYRYDKRLTAKVALEHARPKNSPIHDFFTWDNTKAAHEHRLAEARYLLRSIAVVYEELDDQEPRRASAVLYGDDAKPDAYRLTVDILGEEETRKQLIARALDELRIWDARYKRFKEFAEIIKAHERLYKRKRRSKKKGA